MSRRAGLRTYGERDLAPECDKFENGPKQLA